MMKIHSWTILSLLLVVACSPSKQIVTEPTEYIVTDTLYVQAPSPEKEALAPAMLPVYRATEPRTLDLLHTKLDLRFDFENEYVLGQATLTLTPYFYSTKEVVLDAKNFDIHQVAIDGMQRTVPYKYDGEKLTITLNSAITSKDTLNVVIDYTAKPSEGPEGGSAAIQSDRGLFFINPRNEDPGKPRQIWTQGETEHNSKWFPTIDKPNERCTQEISVTVPDNLKTLSNGLMVNSVKSADGMRTDHWVNDMPHAPYLFMLAIGDFAVVTDSWKNLNVDYYVEPAFKDDARSIFGNTPEMLTFFSDLLGYEYPWQKYAQVVVRDYVSGAMENTTAVIFGEFVQQQTEDLIDNNNDNIVAHEMFHHWFGDLVTCESWSNLTMNEGFANYSEYLWQEHKYGFNEAELHRFTELQGYLEEARNNAHDLINFEYEDKEDMFDRHSYNKGGLILHMLRDLTGDEAFFASLHKYLKENKFSTGEAHQLRLAFEEVTGQDWSWFFNQWFFGTGHPIMERFMSYNEDTTSVILTLNQIQDPEKFEPIFRLPLDVDIYYADGRSKRVSIVVDERIELTEIPVDGPIAWINVDPGKKQLIEYANSIDVDPFFAYDVLEHPIERLYALVQAMQSGKDLSPMVEKYLNDDMWLIRYYALNYVNMTGKEAYRDRLLEIVSNDKNANVRGFALTVIPGLEGAESAMLNAIKNDDASFVRAIALTSLNLTNPDTALALCPQLTDSESPNLLGAIGEVYGTAGRPGDIDFYQAAIDKLPDSRVDAIFESWILYAVNVDAATLQTVIDRWASIAMDKNAGFNARTNAYASMGIVKSEMQDSEEALSPDIKQVLSTINDKRLQAYESVENEVLMARFKLN